MDSYDLRDWSGFVKAGGSPRTPVVIDQITIDSRRIYTHNALFVALPGTRHDGHNFIADAAKAGAKYALVQKGINIPFDTNGIVLLRVENPLTAFQAITKSYRQKLPCKVIGIAGSYGKTMVKDLLHAMLSTSKHVAASPESFNSQIGVPLSLLQVDKDHEIAIIEAGISKVNEMDALADLIVPDFSIITHIGRKHITTLGTVDTAAAEMIKLSKSTNEKGWALIPSDDLLQQHLLEIKATKFFWNEKEETLPHARTLSTERTSEVPFRIDFPDGNHYESRITRGHYFYLDLINLAIKAAWLLGISSQDICSTLTNYTPEPMRTEIWQSPGGATFINDTYCSDPQSVDVALRYFDQCHPNERKIFLFGGMRGDGQYLEKDYNRIGKAIQKAQPELLMLIGKQPYGSLVDEVTSHSPKTSISQFSSYAEAIHQLKATIRPNDFVLIKGERKEPLDHLTEAFFGSICTNQCFINLAAIASNLATIRNKLSKSTRVMVMVKAMAYGTHDVRIAKFLDTQGVGILGVSYVDEGIALRNSGVKQSIFTLNAATYEASKVVEWKFEVGVSEREVIQAIALEAAKQNTTIKVHLHVDTGMNRLGCRPEEALTLAKYILTFPSLKLEGIMTHFACADDPADDNFTFQQSERFDSVINELKENGIEIPWHHAANSSGVMRFHFPQYNMARVGLAIYGLKPSKNPSETLDLRLAISLNSRIVGINVCKKGDTVSYGRNYTVQKDTQRLAVIPIGYFDGLHRNYSSKGCVIIQGIKAPMVGTICMDYMMVDITEIPKASIGDPVLIFGEDEYGNYLSPEELAEKGNSIVYELVTCLGPRIQRIFIHEENQKSC
ncbi:MAG: Alanine racemase [Chlamydiae bacterium]|nr:Alanine racemase [Chlamydiota bacterium]